MSKQNNNYMNNMLEIPCYLANIKRSSQFLANIYDSMMSSLGIKSSQYVLLSVLYHLKKANITEWARSSGLERTTMVRNVQTLLNNNWIEETDGSGKTYKLSKMGQEIFKQAFLKWQETQQEIEQILGKEDAVAILRIAQKFRNLKGTIK